MRAQREGQKSSRSETLRTDEIVIVRVCMRTLRSGDNGRAMMILLFLVPEWWEFFTFTVSLLTSDHDDDETTVVQKSCVYMTQRLYVLLLCAS